MPPTDIENPPSPAACWHLENHTRRDQKLNAPALDEALAKSNKNENKSNVKTQSQTVTHPYVGYGCENCKKNIYINEILHI